MKYCQEPLKHNELLKYVNDKSIIRNSSCGLLPSALPAPYEMNLSTSVFILSCNIWFFFLILRWINFIFIEYIHTIKD